ncbi:coiled-coil domain-containing protein [Actinomadura harenae]|uniref:chromosome segregation ATPase n=1 Tax=Actinomadura harenae TaxID=2483351 RepID=UPI001F483C6C|nr:chromosome segregation ATPase [Actinomadura harenae]
MPNSDERDNSGVPEREVSGDAVARTSGSGEVARMGEPVTVWPCASCGRPVPQPVGAVRAIRYCQDNDGACVREGHERRERGRDAPGLTGQVAATWEMVERLEQAADALAGSLAAELSVAGVERRIAEVRAEAARELSVAQSERDASQRRADEARSEAGNARQRADAADKDATRAREDAKKATAKRDAAQKAWEEAHEIAQQAVTAKLAAESERDRIAARETELLAALESTRADLVAQHAKVAEAEGAAEKQRVEAVVAKQGAEDLRASMRDTEAQRQRAMQSASKAEAERTAAQRAQSESEAENVRAKALAEDAVKERDAAREQASQAIAERDDLLGKLNEHALQIRQLSQSVAEQQAALSALAEERDAARAEADRARRQIDQFTHNTLSSNLPAGRLPGAPSPNTTGAPGMAPDLQGYPDGAPPVPPQNGGMPGSPSTTGHGVPFAPPEPSSGYPLPDPSNGYPPGDPSHVYPPGESGRGYPTADPKSGYPSAEGASAAPLAAPVPGPVGIPSSITGGTPYVGGGVNGNGGNGNGANGNGMNGNGMNGHRRGPDDPEDPLFQGP